MANQQYQQHQYGQMDQTAYEAAVNAKRGWKRDGPVAQDTNNFNAKAQDLARQNTNPQAVSQAYAQSQGYAQQPQAPQPYQNQRPQEPIVRPDLAQSQAPPVPQQVPVPNQQQAQQQDQKNTLVGKKSGKNSTQNNLQIAEIRDGLVIMSDGSFRAVIMAQSINFDLMSPTERESVEYAYQNFLNSLYYPIQIFVRSTKVNMRPYLNKLQKLRSEQDNMLLALLMEDYTYFISSLVQQTNIMDKNFYIVVSFHKGDETRVLGNNVKKEHFSEGRKTSRDIRDIFRFKNNPDAITINEADIEEAKAELKNRVSGVVNGLANIGVQAIPLNTEELIELYYDVYNPDTATRQKLQLSHDLMAPVVVKGKGEAPRPDMSQT